MAKSYKHGEWRVIWSCYDASKDNHPPAGRVTEYRRDSWRVRLERDIFRRPKRRPMWALYQMRDDRGQPCINGTVRECLVAHYRTRGEAMKAAEPTGPGRLGPKEKARA